ncbi:hypothetical protein EJB05_47970, partial [Eragrostis curvula]
MKSIGKAAEFLRKAASALRGKAAVLRARLLFLASLRRRAAVVAGISRHIRSFALSQQRGQEKAAACRAMALSSRPVDHADVDDDERAGTRDGDVVVGMAELASLFQEVEAGGGDGGGYQDWTLALHALFDDEDGSRGCGGGDEHRRAGDDLDDGVEEGLEVEDDADDDEPSVLDLIRSVREGEGQDFRIDDEIDRAAGMFITRVRRRMSKQTDHELVVSGFH